MKCVCGYDDEKNGKDKFTKVYEEFNEVNRYSVLYERGRGIAFYVCPKCGTVRGDIKW